MFDSWEDFFAMGGYARYVWPAYLVTALAVVASIWAARQSLRRAVIDARRHAMEEGE